VLFSDGFFAEIGGRLAGLIEKYQEKRKKTVV
jgi:hypothetical protein